MLSVGMVMVPFESRSVPSQLTASSLSTLLLFEDVDDENVDESVSEFRRCNRPLNSRSHSSEKGCEEQRMAETRTLSLFLALSLSSISGFFFPLLGSGNMTVEESPKSN